jgi:bifunctional UDP-N-acetylglucosamine pyrophosphorylase/glucosamine-1-phosphate N-acetyltransferase
LNTDLKPALHIVILAAGEGTRMRSNLPKVLHTVGGKPMLEHLLQTAGGLNPEVIHAVIGSGADRVREARQRFPESWPINFVEQAERRGTGHAVDQAMPAIPDDVHVLVLLGDHPLIPAPVLQQMLQQPLPPLAVLTMVLDDPKGYGRIERDRTGRINGIVEERDATPAQRAIHEVNTGIILAQAGPLRHWLQQLECSNSKNEYYLTDIFARAYKEGYEIRAVQAPDPRDLQGANDRRQVAALEHRYRQRMAEDLMEKGVSLLDPARIDVRGPVTVGRDVVIDINVVLEGENELGDGVLIGPGCVLTDCRLAAGTVVRAYSVLEGVRTTGACEIGPFARLRPGTELSKGSRIGNFVEVKNSRLGENSKANHLSYVGDAQVGDRVNIGAGTITCNYDGANKYQTIIEDEAFIGSDAQLVAPVTIGKGATIGAGTTVTKDAPAGELTISRTRQHTVTGWKRPAKKDLRKKDS